MQKLKKNQLEVLVYIGRNGRLDSYGWTGDRSYRNDRLVGIADDLVAAGLLEKSVGRRIQTTVFSVTADGGPTWASMETHSALFYRITPRGFATIACVEDDATVERCRLSVMAALDGGIDQSCGEHDADMALVAEAVRARAKQAA